MKKLIFGLILSLFLATAANTHANYGAPCTPIYGGGETCITVDNIRLDKKVSHPTQTETKGGKQLKLFVDNLSINDPKYKAQETVTFQIHVTNIGDKVLESVEVKDTLPQYVTFVSGPGKFDANTKTLTYTLENLKVNETKTVTIEAKIVEEGKLPNESGVLCVVNLVSLTTKNGQVAEDNAQFCIEKKVLASKGGLPVKQAPPITQAPPTGPEMAALFALIPAGLSGLILRRRSLKIKGGENHE